MKTDGLLLKLLILIRRHDPEARLLGNMQAKEMDEAIVGILEERNELLKSLRKHSIAKNHRTGACWVCGGFWDGETEVHAATCIARLKDGD